MRNASHLTEKSTISELLRRATLMLEEGSTLTPRLDAEVLLCFVSGMDRPTLYAHPERTAEPYLEAEFFRLVSSRAAGRPLQQITGSREFWSLDFRVDERALIPRPETELLVEEGVRLLRAGAETVWVLDVGTGSGNIAVALASELPSAKVVAADVSWRALELARENVTRHRLQDRVHLLQGDLCRPLKPGRQGFDLVVSNPPYISDREWEKLPPSVREFEPEVALRGGPGGVEVISRLICEVPPLLKPNARFIFEIGFSMMEDVSALLNAAPGLRLEKIIKDYSGIERVVVARRT